MNTLHAKIQTILEKRSDLVSELASNINPINAIGKPFAAIGALATPTWTDEQLQAADLADSKERARQFLLPGVGDYNVWKRMGHGRQKMLAHEKNQNKQASMNTEQAYINGFFKKASEYGFDENQAAALLKQAGAKDTAASTIRNAMAGILKRPRSTMAGAGAVSGGIGGAGLGAGVGALNGLINPGQEMNAETGQLEDKSRLMAMLTGGLKGTAVGGGVGAGLGGLGGYASGASLATGLQDPKLRRALRKGMVREGKGLSGIF